MNQEHKTGGQPDRRLSPSGDTVTEIPLVSVSTPRLINVHGVSSESGPQDLAQPAWSTLDESLVDNNFATGNHWWQSCTGVLVPQNMSNTIQRY